MDYRYEDDYDYRRERPRRRVKEVEYLPHGRTHVLERKVLYSEGGGSEGHRGRTRAFSPERRYDRYAVEDRYGGGGGGGEYGRYEPAHHHVREVYIDRVPTPRERSPRRRVHHMGYGGGHPHPGGMMVGPCPPPPFPPPPKQRVEVPMPYPVPVPVYRSQWNSGEVNPAMFGQPPLPPPN